MTQQVVINEIRALRDALAATERERDQALRALMDLWDAIGPEVQDNLIESGWHPARDTIEPVPWTLSTRSSSI